ncbi:MAG: hypothetical protein WKF59_20480 [Chitinophagaceae bacterium]
MRINPTNVNTREFPFPVKAVAHGIIVSHRPGSYMRVWNTAQISFYTMLIDISFEI